ncbi:MAG: enoyl-CoA hydratase/isomerase family protein, partial [Candidatus Tectomicrobia bacterium]|nr:enoyl-CoA hydratase/isomerase family protein [Candidatus Tectomicrobia bacterium]
MPFDNLLVEISEGVALLTINRPEVRNALDPRTWEELARAVGELEGDGAAGVIVITGAGDKAFAAGSDIRQIQERTLLDGLAAPPSRALMRIEAAEKPLIAAVNGFALGGGCELALACDLRIASEQARFGQPEVNLGIIPGAGGTQRLVSLVGLGKAKELVLTGDVIDAREALRIGLVNQVVPHAELLPAARAMARRILAKGPLAVRLAKIALNARAQHGPDAGMLVERLAQSCLMTTADKREGTAA